jgi:hypothetical protein
MLKIPTGILGRITRDSENAVYEHNVLNDYLITTSMQWTVMIY